MKSNYPPKAVMICSHCKIEKPCADFGKSTHGRLGLNNIRYKYICRACDYKIIKSKHISQPHVRLFHLAKRRAEKRNIEFSLTKDLIKQKFPKDSICPVTKKPFEYDVKNRNQNPTIDRIDNTKGYTYDNIVIVSYIVNKIKNDLTDFSIFKQIVKFYDN